MKIPEQGELFCHGGGISAILPYSLEVISSLDKNIFNRPRLIGQALKIQSKYMQCTLSL
jgi:hypothetical protein